ncbi:DUF2460 domain-containing protein [Bacillus litorisediminis]|uniref:DUF2460 domain-containing protein n=1 Tax=Bacillus litorisediminis TaxID=2922713 RepID=UPI001FAD20DC|nr:DUF2460 domain-containing protein [Bacillus litorisediminis]
MAQFSPRPVPEPPLLRIEPFKGMNLSVTPTQIDQSQSPDMLNMNIDERGALNKRTGYERVFPTSLGVGQINGLYEYRKKDGTVKFLIAHGTKLYTQSGSDQPVEIYNGLANNRVNFFTMNDKCYILDGTNYLVYDGTAVLAVTPYIPTLSISKLPAGGGEPYEDFNLLGAGFKDSFSADGTATVFQLSLTNLDAIAVTAVVDGVNKAETTDFTVDRVNGKVTFTTAPAKGTNNVIITAYKTQVGFPDRIKKCRFHTIFGGANDTRVFVAGNPERPDEMWRSGLQDPSYFPENGNYKMPGNIMGFAKQYDYLVVERDNGKHVVNYQLVDGVASFPSKPINDQVGTIAQNSIQIIENNPVSLSKDGVYMLTASNVRDERNVSHLSENIDARLLNEPNLENAVSVEYDKKYWLAVNGNVYLYDYVVGEWFFYDNIKANCFIERNRELYFGSSEEGLLYRFMKDTEGNPYNDDGAPIVSYWKSKQFTFGADELRKLVEKVYFGMKPMTRTSADLYYVSNKKESALIKTSRMDLLDFRNIDFNNWSFIVSSFPQESMAKIKAKKITHFQLVIKNDKLDEGLGLLSVGMKYRYQSAVK